MSRRIIKIFCLSGILFAASVVYGQVVPRVAGLENNSEYMDLLEQEQVLRMVEDSLGVEVAEVRKKFREAPQGRAEFGKDILRLEGEMFDIRNSIGIIAGRINTIEQQFILNNLDSGRQDGGLAHEDPVFGIDAGGRNGSPQLIDDEYFSSNLSAGDYAALRQAQEDETDIGGLIAEYGSAYDSMTRLAAVYETADSAATADSIFALYGSFADDAYAISDDIGKLWEYIYDNKSFAYNYLLEKMDRGDLLSAYGRKASDATQKHIDAKEWAMSDAISLYAVQKELIFDYEITLAELLGLGLALDSLKTARAGFLNGGGLDFPKMEVEERLFLDYADIQTSSPPKYNSRNPVPECTVYEKGIIYRIHLGHYTRLQPVSLFKGVYPLGYVKDAEGEYDYYAGGFDSREKADTAVVAMKKLGFKNPCVAQWDWEKYTLFEAPEPGEQMFRIEIGAAGASLPEAVGQAVSDNTPGKEISRVGDMFIIGSFDTAEQAQAVADAIAGAAENLSVKITAVGL